MDLRYQQRFDAQGQALAAALLAAEKAVQTALIAAEKAVAKAETATEKRFESVNEFRQTLADQTAGFPSRVELEALAARVAELAARTDRSEGRTRGITAGWGILVGAVLVVGTIIGAVLAIRG